MKKHNKARITLILLLVVGLLIPTICYAKDYTVGFSGVSQYQSPFSTDNCVLENRAGAEYIQNLYNGLNIKIAGKSCNYVSRFMNKNNSATESDAIVGSRLVDFFAYAGHGISFDTDNALHYKKGTTNISHSDNEYNDTFNAHSSEIRFGGRNKWAVLYTCNQLTNNGSEEKQKNIFRMMEGNRLIMGFCSVMYLDSREGTLFGKYAGSGYNYVDSFIDAARVYQVQRQGGDSMVRVIGHKSARYDSMFDTNLKTIPESSWYKNKPEDYGCLETVTIYHTGEKVK